MELQDRRNGNEMVLVTCEYLCKNGLQWMECWGSFDGEDSVCGFIQKVCEMGPDILIDHFDLYSTLIVVDRCSSVLEAFVP